MAKNQSEGCRDCPFGYYQDFPGKTRCKTCSHGAFAITTSKCQDWTTCGIGTYISLNGNSSHDRTCKNCSQGTFGNSQNKDKCEICHANTFQNLTGKNACTNCPNGKYTKLVALQFKSFHDDISDCLYPPKIESLYPDNSTTQGGINTSFYGEYFGASTSTIQLKVGGTLWDAQIMNSTWIRASSSAGSGKGLHIEIIVDGIAGTSNVNFSYAPPFIGNITSPPLKGGTMQISGRDFVNQHLLVNVYEGGCIRPCSNVQFISHTLLQCQYNGVGTEGEFDKKLVKVSVDGQTSNGMYLRYYSDRGDLVGVPSNLQRTNENSTIEYSISLTLNPNPNVIVNLEASLLNPPTHPTMICSVSPSQIQFSNMTSKAITVRVGGNRVDEGTDAMAFQCKITHTIESSDPQYKNVPSRYMDVAVVNDDVADVKLWTFDERKNKYGFDVKFIGPLCNAEGGHLKYGIRLETEPTKLVHILPKVSMLNTSYIEIAPTIRLNTNMLVFSPSNWSIIQPVIAQSLQDSVDNDDMEFKISHDVVSEDTIFATKASQLPMSTVFTVTDDDTAGIKINTNVLTIQEDGLAKSINFIGLSTKPVANVEIRIHVDSSLIDAMPISFNINRDTTESTWKNINQQIAFRAKNGASSATARIVCSSNDQKYNVTFTEVSIVVQPLQRTLNVPKEGTTIEGQSYTYKLSLTTVPLSNVAIQLNVIGSCAISNSTLIVSDKKEQSITVQAPDNFVDEGATQPIDV